MEADRIRAPADAVQSLPPIYRAVFDVLVRNGKAVVDDAPNQVSA
jgi:hypothetical protein